MRKSVVAWPIFGSSNQLLAALTLLALVVWLKHQGRCIGFVLLPLAVMLVLSLFLLAETARVLHHRKE